MLAESVHIDGVQWVRWTVVILAAVAAAVIDLRRRRIPNAITLPLLLSGVAAAWVTGGLSHAGDALLGAVVAGAPFVILWLIGGGGAGDAKMMLAIGAWLGPTDAVVALVCVAILGGLVSIAHAIARGTLRKTLGRLAGLGGLLLYLVNGPGNISDRRDVLPQLNAREGVPYGVAICLGLCVAVCVTATGVKPW